MTCKDCLHYEAHKHFFNSPNYEKDFDDYFKDIEHKCPEFTNRSEWVHLLCKVGDTVHYFSGDFGTILPYFVENLNIAYLGEKGENCVYTFEANCNHENELLDSIDFEPDDIGKTVFLTREEAEKALEEKK